MSEFLNMVTDLTDNAIELELRKANPTTAYYAALEAEKIRRAGHSESLELKRAMSTMYDDLHRISGVKQWIGQK